MLSGNSIIEYDAEVDIPNAHKTSTAPQESTTRGLYGITPARLHGSTGFNIQ